LLDSDVSLEGTTSRYHAVAKAEELVRTSRTASIFEFDYIMRDKFLEPGDVVRLYSEDLKLGDTADLFIKLDEVTPQENGTCQVSGSRFDWTQLAWNVDDNQYITPTPLFESGDIAPPEYLEYIPANETTKNSTGLLIWLENSDPRISHYVLFVHVIGELYEQVGLLNPFVSDGEYLFRRLGEADESPFQLPEMIVQDVIFGIQAVARDGARSEMVTTSTVALNPAVPPTPTNLTIAIAGERRQAIDLAWGIPVARADGTPYNNHYATRIYRNIIDDFDTAKRIGDSLEILAHRDVPTEFGDLYYWVVFGSYSGVDGPPSASAFINYDYYETLKDINFKPPAPMNVTAVSFIEAIRLYWENPIYNESGGHASTLIFGVKWPEGNPQPTFIDAVPIATVADTQAYSHAVGSFERWVYWLKSKSVGNGVSDETAGPVIATSNSTAEKVLESIEGQISELSLDLGLADRINLIDTPSTGLLTKVSDLEIVYGSTVSAAESAESASSYASLSASNATQSLLIAGNFEFTSGAEGWSSTTETFTQIEAPLVAGVVGRAISLTGANKRGIWARRLPIQTSRVYRLRFRVKSVSGAPSQFFAGLVTYDNNGNAETAGATTEVYPSVDYNTLPTAGDWYVYESVITGVGTDNNSFRSTTAFASPTFIVNYQQSGAETTHVDECSLTDITDALASAVSASNAEASKTAAGQSASAAIVSSTEAGNYAANASTLVGQASNFSDMASNSASASIASATEAGNQAASASTFSTQASTFADAAEASAIEAANVTSQDLTQLQTTVDDNTAAVEASLLSINGIQAQWTIKTDVNDKVSGIGLINSGTESLFEVLADNFAVYHPSASQSLVFGVSGGKTVMDGAYIKDATVDRLQVKDAAIGTLQVGLNEITFPRGTSSDTNVTVHPNQFPNILSLGFTATGAPVIVTITASVHDSDNEDTRRASSAYMSLYRGTTKLFGFFPFGAHRYDEVGLITSQWIAGVASAQIHIPAGVSGTYHLQVSTNTIGTIFGARSLTIMEAKR